MSVTGIGAIVACVFAAAFAWWASARAWRIDGLHRASDRARTALTDALANRRRAANAVVDVVSERYPEACARVGRALDTPVGDSTGESELTRQMRALAALCAAEENGGDTPAARAWRCWNDASFVLIAARRFANDRVAQVRRARSPLAVRLLHLAGRAPLPVAFDMDDEWEDRDARCGH